jgi:hypothetical protein
MANPATSPAGRQFLEGAREHCRAQAEGDVVVREAFTRLAKQKGRKANRVATVDDARAVGARAVVRNDGSGVALVDTYDNPKLLHAQAQVHVLELSDRNGTLEAAIDMSATIGVKNSVERALAHQMAAAHAEAFKLLRRGNERLEQAECHANLAMMQGLNVEGVRLLNASARMMGAFNAAAETLAKLRTGGKQTVTVVHQHVQVAGGTVAVAGHIEGKGGGDDRG